MTKLLLAIGLAVAALMTALPTSQAEAGITCTYPNGVRHAGRCPDFRNGRRTRVTCGGRAGHC